MPSPEQSRRVLVMQTWLVLRHSRGDLGLQEDQDKDQESWTSGSYHHPNREGLLLTHGVDKPAPG